MTDEELIAEARAYWARNLAPEPLVQQLADALERHKKCSVSLSHARIDQASGFSVRTVNALHSDGIMTIRDLLGRRAEELLPIKNFGRKCLAEVRALLAEAGLYLRGEG